MLTEESQQPVDQRQHGIDARRGVAGFDQSLLVGNSEHLRFLPTVPKRRKFTHIMWVLVNGVRSLFRCDEVTTKAGYVV